jgi:hypothetical protein
MSEVACGWDNCKKEGKCRGHPISSRTGWLDERMTQAEADDLYPKATRWDWLAAAMLPILLWLLLL